MLLDIETAGGVLVQVVDIDNLQHTLVMRNFDKSLLRGFDQVQGCTDGQAEHTAGTTDLLRVVMYGREDLV